MSASVQIYVEDIDERIADFDRIRLYRDTTPTGTFGTLVETFTLVAEQTLYTTEDEDGSPGSWYRYQFYNTATVDEGAFSPPFRVGGGTLEQMRLAAARQASAGFSSTVTGTSTATSLVDDLLRDEGVDPGFLGGAWLRRPSAVDGDVLRSLGSEPFNPTTGALTPIREWNAAPTIGETYEVYTLLPPTDRPGYAYSWDRAVRDGLELCWFVDQFEVGVGDDAEWEFSLAGFPGLAVDRIRRVLLRSEHEDWRDIDAGKGGRFWKLNRDGSAVALQLSSVPRNGMRVIVEAVRTHDPVYRDDDEITLPQDLVAAATVFAAYQHLNGATATRGQYTAELVAAQREFERLYVPIQPATVIREGW